MKRIAGGCIRILNYAVVAMFITSSFVASWWLLYPYNPIEVAPIKIMNPCKEVQQGGTLIYELDYDKKMPLTSVLNRSLIDTYTITYAPGAGHAKVGKGVAHTHLPIPKYATPGVYFMRWSSTYQVNPLRKVTVTVDSEKFVVYPSDRTRICTESDTAEDFEDDETRH